MSSSLPAQDFINALRAIFGRRAILFGEDAARYDDLLRLIADDVKPQTMREWLVVKDVVDAQWEYWRIRGFKAGAFNAALPRFIAEEIATADGRRLLPDQTKKLVEQLLRVLSGDEGARATFASLLAEYQLSMDGIAAMAFIKQMPLQLDLDDRADAVRCRRNAAYDELDSLREKASRQPVTPLRPIGTVQHIDTSASIIPHHAAEASGQHREAIGPPAETMPRNADESAVIGDPVVGGRSAGS